MVDTVTVRVTDTLGVKSAELALAPGEVVEVAGPNASGKSSVAACAQAVLAQHGNPLGLSAVQRAAYARFGDGAGDPEVRLDDGEAADTVWHPLAGKVTASGPPLCSPAAVGLVDFASRGGDARLRALHDALLPPLDELVEMVRGALAGTVEPGDVDAAVETLRDRGWAGAESVYADRAREAKRHWAAAAKQNYGPAVAVDWRPDGWHADLDSLTVESAEERARDSRDALAALHQVAALSEREAEERDAALARLPGLEAALEEAEGAVAGRNAELADLNLDGARRRRDAAKDEAARLVAAAGAAEDALEELGGDPSTPCPLCAGPVVIADGALHAFDERRHGDLLAAAEARAAEARAAAAAAEAALDQAHAEVTDLARRHSEIEGLRSAATRAAGAASRDLDAAQRAASVPGEVGDPPDTGAAQERLAAAERDLSMVARKREADLHQDSVVRYQRVARQFGPQGARAQILSARLNGLNRGLAVLCAEAGWPLVEIHDDGAATWGGRPASACSESERWRVQALAQVTVAAVQGSPFVVLDRADVLDPEQAPLLVAALRRALAKAAVGVLMCRTGGGAPSGADRVYEIDAGRTKEGATDERR